MSTTFVPVRGSLVDAVFPDVRSRNAIVVAGGVLFVALLAQIRIPLPFTPVPVTGQTLGVALVGAGLGWKRGALALGLYVLLGAIGLPFFAGGQSGWDHVMGATGGYLVGFVAAAALVGFFAARGLDRSPWKAFFLFQAGSAVIFLCGLTGLRLTMGVSWADATNLGFLPFWPGDLVKTAIAAGLFPALWRLVSRFTTGD